MFSIKVVPVNVSDIKFTSKQPSSSTPPPRKSCQIVPPTESELHEFYETLNCSTQKPAILKITQPYSKQFIPLLAEDSFPCHYMILMH